MHEIDRIEADWSDMSNTLIAFFSRAGQNYVNGTIRDLPVGNTEVVAHMVARATGGDLFRIETVREYAADYQACVKESMEEMRTAARPELRGLPEGLDEYDIVILGYPNWCGTMPMPVYTFLEAFDFSGKVIAPFCTHEGSGLSGTEGEIARVCPVATVVGGLAVHGADAPAAEPAVRSWLARLR